MEIDFSGKVFIKQGTIYSYSGNLTFWVKEKRPGAQATLVIITGTGKLLLTDKDREITFMRVGDETIHVEPAHLLACEEGVTPRYVRIGDKPNDLEFLALKGAGMVALSVASKPLPLSVTPDLPVSVPASSVITWSGDLVARVVEDRQIYEVMHVRKARARSSASRASGGCWSSKHCPDPLPRSRAKNRPRGEVIPARAETLRSMTTLTDDARL